MSQTKAHSIIEAAVSNALSLIMSCVGNMVVFPLFGITPSWRQALQIGSTFTLIFIVKSYFIRRLFNRWHQ